MKKLLLIAAVMFGFAANVNAQDTGFAVGGQVVMGTGSGFTNYGIGVRGQYYFTENFRGEITGDYFFKKDHVTYFDVNAMVHYVFNINDKFSVYPLGGVGLMGASTGDETYSSGGSTIHIEGSTSTEFIFNLGGGVEYRFADKIRGFVEAKEQFKDGSRFNLSVGVMFDL
ncbi:MAG: porin family protein [Prevotella sp.]|nr:porin family protein [Prevotella sp.]